MIDDDRMDDVLFAATFRAMVERMKEVDLLSAGCAESLLKRDLLDVYEFEQATLDVVDAIVKRDYYKLLERIERGEQLIAEETDVKRKAGYEKFMAKLIAELEVLRN